jgi:MFS family permease
VVSASDTHTTARGVHAPAAVGARPDESGYPSALRAAYLLGVLVLAADVAYLDLQIFALLITPIKAALRLSDTHVGALQGLGFNVSVGLGAIPLAFVIDRRNRVRLLTLSAIGWTAFTILTGFATGFWGLLACRIGVGIAKASLYPTAFSLIADLYPPEKRANGMFVFFAGALVGGSVVIALGGVMIGFVAAHSAAFPGVLGTIAPWRLTFFAAALPSAVLVLFLLIASEPHRDGAKANGVPDGRQISFIAYFQRRWLAVARLNAGLILASLGSDVVLFWTPTILTRSFGLSGAEAGETFAVAFGVGSVSGVGLGWAATRALRARWKSLAPLQAVRFAATAAVFVPLFGLFFARGLVPFLLVVSVAVALFYVGNAITPSIINDFTPNRLRGQMFTLHQIVGLLPAMIWPPAVGLLSDRVFTGSNALLLAAVAVVATASLLAPILLARIENSFQRLSAGA